MKKVRIITTLKDYFGHCLFGLLCAALCLGIAAWIMISMTYTPAWIIKGYIANRGVPVELFTVVGIYLTIGGLALAVPASIYIQRLVTALKPYYVEKHGCY